MSMPSFLSLLSVLSLASGIAHASSHKSHSPTIATAWYAGWHSNDFPVTKISWNKYSSMTYAFAVTTPDVHVLSLEDSHAKVLPQFVKEAHKHGVAASVSIGGWTGSRYYSSMVDSAHNRTAFVHTVTKFAKKYRLDGIDFDWEYPNQQGLGCNIINSADTANFLLFLQELRRHPLGAKLTLSAATSISPFKNSNGTASTDVSAFSKVLDYVALMNYDIWGGWSTGVGPNAPLFDACAKEENRQGSAMHAVQAWNAAGFSRDQIVLAVPSYGHSFRVHIDQFKANSTYPLFDAKDKTVGDAWDDVSGEPDKCGVVEGPGGNINYWGMIKLGYLTKAGKTNKGINYRYDSCSQTPYMYNPKTETMVSYDNPRSFAAKGKFIKDQGLAGFALWEAGGDYKDALLNSIRHSSGVKHHHQKKHQRNE